MATGDQYDMLARLKSVLPQTWFGNTPTPNLNAQMAGPGWMFSYFYIFVAYLKLQVRIMTATDGWLDLIALDYFGSRLTRKPNQQDNAFRARILSELLRPRNTRASITKALVDLTGRAPIIFEPQRPADTGAYGAGILGYGAAGGYGSTSFGFQALVTAFRPIGQGIANVDGYGGSIGGYGVGAIEYAGQSLVAGSVADSDIYAAVASVASEPVVLWTQIKS